MAEQRARRRSSAEKRPRFTTCSGSAQPGPARRAGPGLTSMNLNLQSTYAIRGGGGGGGKGGRQRRAGSPRREHLILQSRLD